MLENTESKRVLIWCMEMCPNFSSSYNFYSLQYICKKTHIDDSCINIFATWKIHLIKRPQLDLVYLQYRIFLAL
jgi:hypothetical protein